MHDQTVLGHADAQKVLDHVRAALEADQRGADFRRKKIPT